MSWAFYLQEALPRAQQFSKGAVDEEMEADVSEKEPAKTSGTKNAARGRGMGRGNGRGRGKGRGRGANTASNTKAKPSPKAKAKAKSKAAASLKKNEAAAKPKGNKGKAKNKEPVPEAANLQTDKGPETPQKSGPNVPEEKDSDPMKPSARKRLIGKGPAEPSPKTSKQTEKDCPKPPASATQKKRPASSSDKTDKRRKEGARPSFARRYRPEVQSSGMEWDAMREVFLHEIGPAFKHPGKMQDLG